MGWGEVVAILTGIAVGQQAAADPLGAFLGLLGAIVFLGAALWLLVRRG